LDIWKNSQVVKALWRAIYTCVNAIAHIEYVLRFRCGQRLKSVGSIRYSRPKYARKLDALLAPWEPGKWNKLAERTGLEPATPGVTGKISSAYAFLRNRMYQNMIQYINRKI